MNLRQTPRLLTANNEVMALRTKLLRGFTDPSRLLILELLRDGPLTMSDIVEATGFTPLDVSAHVTCLCECGLVVAKHKELSAAYEMSDRRVGQFLNLIDELLVDVAQGVSDCTRYHAFKEPTHD